MKNILKFDFVVRYIEKQKAATIRKWSICSLVFLASMNLSMAFINAHHDNNLSTIFSALVAGWCLGLLCGIVTRPASPAGFTPADKAWLMEQVEHRSVEAVKKQFTKFPEDGSRAVLARLFSNLEELVEKFEIPANDPSLAMVHTCGNDLWAKFDDKMII